MSTACLNRTIRRGMSSVENNYYLIVWFFFSNTEQLYVGRWPCIVVFVRFLLVWKRTHDFGLEPWQGLVKQKCSLHSLWNWPQRWTPGMYFTECWAENGPLDYAARGNLPATLRQHVQVMPWAKDCISGRKKERRKHGCSQWKQCENVRKIQSCSVIIFSPRSP